MTILAIDPGTSGCLVVVDDGGTYVDHLHMPTVKLGSRNRVNAAAVAAWVGRYKPDHCYLEQVHSMPGQGVSSTFAFGHAAGTVEGVICGLGIPMTLVTPQRWKRHVGLIGSDKDAARSRAIQLFPTLRALDAKGKGQALADALLIAVYARESAERVAA